MFKLFPIFDLAVKRSRSTQEHHLNIYGCTGVPISTYRVQGRRSIDSGEEDF